MEKRADDLECIIKSIKYSNRELVSLLLQGKVIDAISTSGIIKDTIESMKVDEDHIEEPLRGSEIKDDKCVHTEHCCYDHGCKYGDEDCPVAEGTKRQSSPCEICNMGSGYSDGPEKELPQYMIDKMTATYSRVEAGPGYSRFHPVHIEKVLHSKTIPLPVELIKYIAKSSSMPMSKMIEAYLEEIGEEV
jgi:hypothetical protein